MSLGWMTYSWWLDDEGHPWIRHVCNGVVDEYRMPPPWHLATHEGKPAIVPSLDCERCGTHSILTTADRIESPTPWLDHSGFCATNNGYDTCTCGLDAALGFLAEEPVCSHGIYHHGCPSCDRQDPEDRE